ncbi:uncharacterized protein LOC110466762 [Mizuhopecten yessoensis]|nr:uncharacterized protein LOC110466762 [Mizuhopecten yessoensis]XP_021379177.1 uncharacterized protein LOC110466762 [Mizuhopecten yessoensis]XP_021379178.1 uncharacterized protein LOC110466762 [Mizuhopecten yessoensis]XP_021379179.1 uncharacterized protein LOC110466762 [Mizuhopecten yessoensis]
MTNFIKLSNETYSSSASSDERFANFSFSPKATGGTMVVFKGLMSLVNPIGADPIKAAVKFYRNNNDKTAAGIWNRKASAYIQNAVIGEAFATNFKNITFPKCFMTTIETVSTLNRQFKMTDGHHRKLRKNELALFESYIDGSFQSFVDDDGTIQKGCPEQLEAFCHFAYHESRGKMIVTGVKGVRANGKFQLTAPKIHSMGGNFGPDDSGQEAVFKFFLGHKCKRSCKTSWRHPLSSPSAFDLGRITSLLSINQNPRSATPPPSYKSVIQLVCGNQCHRFLMGDNSVVVLPEHYRQHLQTGRELDIAGNTIGVSDAVSSLQCG